MKMVVHAPSNEILYLGKHEEHIASVCVCFLLKVVKNAMNLKP